MSSFRSAKQAHQPSWLALTKWRRRRPASAHRHFGGAEAAQKAFSAYTPALVRCGDLAAFKPGRLVVGCSLTDETGLCSSPAMGNASARGKDSPSIRWDMNPSFPSGSRDFPYSFDSFLRASFRRGSHRTRNLRADGAGGRVPREVTRGQDTGSTGREARAVTRGHPTGTPERRESMPLSVERLGLEAPGKFRPCPPATRGRLWWRRPLLLRRKCIANTPQICCFYGGRRVSYPG